MGFNYILDNKESVDYFEIKDEEIVEAVWEEELQPLDWSANNSLIIDEEQLGNNFFLDNNLIEYDSINYIKKVEEEIVEPIWEEGIEFIEFSINSPIGIDEEYFFCDCMNK